MRRNSPSKVDLAGALPHIRFEITSFLFEPEDNGLDHYFTESLAFRRMAHARALISFFTDKATDGHVKNDDALADDYIYLGPPPFSKTEIRDIKDRINKHLFHITYARAKLAPNEKRWPQETIFPPVITSCKDFVSHVLGKCSPLSCTVQKRFQRPRYPLVEMDSCAAR